jgi:hypothetical protein
MINQHDVRIIFGIIISLTVSAVLLSQKSFSTVIVNDNSDERGVQLVPLQDGRYLLCSNNAGCQNSARSYRLDILDHNGVHEFGRQLDYCPFDQWAADWTAVSIVDTIINVYIAREDSLAPRYDINTYLARLNFNLDLIDVLPVSSTELFDIPRSIRRSGNHMYMLEGRGQQGRGDSIRFIKSSLEGDIVQNFAIVPDLGMGNTPTLGMHVLNENRFLINSRYYFSIPHFAPQVLMIDSMGVLILDKGYEELDLPVDGLRCNSSIQTGMNEESFALSWCRDSFMGPGYFTREHIVIHKYNGEGSRIWESLIPMRYESEVFRMTAMSDNSLVCVGIGAHERGLRGGWVFKLSQNGDILWNKVFTHVNDQFNSFFEGAVELDNGSIGIIGTINNINSSDSWVLVLDSLGCLKNQCDSVLITSIETDDYINQEENILIYPNPSSGDKVTISYPSSFKPSRVEVINELGNSRLSQEIQGGLNSFELDISDLRNGTYIIILLNEVGLRISSVLVVNNYD